MSYYHTQVFNNIWEIKADNITGCFTKAFVVNTQKANYVIDTLLGSNSVDHICTHINNNLPIFIINTHYHWDHIWGNAFVENAIIIQHHKCSINIKKHWEEMYTKKNDFIDGITRNIEPTIEFEQRLILNNEIELYHTPGHTNDSISAILNNTGIVFVGDNIGDDDTEIVPSLYDPSNYLKTLNDYCSLDAKYYVSGHSEIKGKKTIEQIISLYKEKIA